MILLNHLDSIEVKLGAVPSNRLEVSRDISSNCLSLRNVKGAKPVDKVMILIRETMCLLPSDDDTDEVKQDEKNKVRNVRNSLNNFTLSACTALAEEVRKTTGKEDYW